MCYGNGAPSEVQEVQADAGVVWSLTDSLTAPEADGGSVPADQGLYRAFRIPTLY